MLTSPTVVDFGDVNPQELDRNYKPRGGRLEVKSLESAVQQQRELTNLIAIYPSLADIPISPKEPADPYGGEPSEERMFGSPDEKTKVRPIRSVGYWHLRADKNIS
jgi:hypothetical protein